MQISNIAWSFAKAGMLTSQFLSKLAELIVPKIHYFNEKDLAATAWALGQAGKSI